MSRSRAAVVGLLAALAATALGAAQDFTKAESDSLERKVQAITKRGLTPPPKAPAPAPLRTSLTEREVNAYFKFNKDLFPPGVVNPRLSFSDAGRLAAQATVDLDAVRKSRPRSALDPMNIVALAGSVNLLVNGTLKSREWHGHADRRIREPRRDSDPGRARSRKSSRSTRRRRNSRRASTSRSRSRCRSASAK